MHQSTNPAFQALTRKLDRLGTLQPSDREAVAALPFRLATVAPATHLVREGDLVTECCLLLTGYSFRYKIATNGNRQIVSFHLPGDILDLQHLVLPKADHGVQTLTEAMVAWIPVSALVDLAQERPAIGQALWRDTLVDASIFREWILNVGQRDAKARIAHMLCEFAVRRDAAGLGSPERFELPMSQEHIADATGLTTVHVNRTLMALAGEGVIVRDKRDIKIADWERMRRIAGFHAKYLHMAA